MGMAIVIEDGPTIEVLERVSSSEVTCKVITDGTVKAHKTVSVRGLEKLDACALFRSTPTYRHPDALQGNIAFVRVKEKKMGKFDFIGTARWAQDGGAIALIVTNAKNSAYSVSTKPEFNEVSTRVKDSD